MRQRLEIVNPIGKERGEGESLETGQRVAEIPWATWHGEGDMPIRRSPGDMTSTAMLRTGSARQDLSGPMWGHMGLDLRPRPWPLHAISPHQRKEVFATATCYFPNKTVRMCNIGSSGSSVGPSDSRQDDIGSMT